MHWSRLLYMGQSFPSHQIVTLRIPIKERRTKSHINLYQRHLASGPPHHQIANLQHEANQVHYRLGVRGRNILKDIVREAGHHRGRVKHRRGKLRCPLGPVRRGNIKEHPHCHLRTKYIPRPPCKPYPNNTLISRDGIFPIPKNGYTTMCKERQKQRYTRKSPN